MIGGFPLLLIFFAVVGSALMGGVFFAFSTFVMKALERLPPPQGIAAMQSINVAVINPAFMSAFLGTAGACVILAIISVLRWHTPGAGLLLSGSLLYFLGTFAVTMVFNVPLNNSLAAVDPPAPRETVSGRAMSAGGRFGIMCARSRPSRQRHFS